MAIIQNNNKKQEGYYTRRGVRLTLFTFKILAVNCLNSDNPFYKVEAFNGFQTTVFLLKNVNNLTSNSFQLSFLNEGCFTVTSRFNAEKMNSILVWELNKFIKSIQEINYAL